MEGGDRAKNKWSLVATPLKLGEGGVFVE